MQGGEPGKAGRNLLYRVGEPAPIHLQSLDEIQVEPGDRIVVETPGGGGYGSEAQSSSVRRAGLRMESRPKGTPHDEFYAIKKTLGRSPKSAENSAG